MVTMDETYLFIWHIFCSPQCRAREKNSLQRRVRPGDPLSPLLFVLTADLLQSVLNHEKEAGNLQLRISLEFTNDFPVLQYADDTLIFLEGEVNQLSSLKSTLQSFSVSTSLKVNFSKSMLVPINMIEEEASALA